MKGSKFCNFSTPLPNQMLQERVGGIICTLLLCPLLADGGVRKEDMLASVFILWNNQGCSRSTKKRDKNEFNFTNKLMVFTILFKKQTKKCLSTHTSKV